MECITTDKYIDQTLDKLIKYNNCPQIIIYRKLAT